MLLDLTYTVVGFALLLWGADRFVEGAGGLARTLGVAPVIIGITIVGFATSAPEIMVSIRAASGGLTGLAVGNAIGSNIANVGLVLGATALLAPIRGSVSASLRVELLVLVVFSFAALLLFVDLALSLLDGIVLLATLAGFMLWLIRTANYRGAGVPATVANVEDLPPRMPISKALLYLLVGIVVLLGGAELLVNGAANVAARIGVSDLVIGLTIVAVGTSLPELAVSVISALKGDPGIAVGNVLGSNLFNLLAVIGFAAIIGPGPLDASILLLHYPLMLAYTLALLLLAYNPVGEAGIGRVLGSILLIVFVGYQFGLLSGA